MSGLWNFSLWLVAFYLIWKSVQFLFDIKRLLNVRDFYLYLLGIPDDDMQTVTWQDVVARIMTLRDHNLATAQNLSRAQRHFLGSQSKERLDASDIANRLMRRENYMIALFNKDILDMSIPLPLVHNYQLLSRALEFALNYSILDFVFDSRGQVNQLFLKADRRGELSIKLRQRFQFSGVMILLMSPFVVGYLVIVYFLTYFHVGIPTFNSGGVDADSGTYRRLKKTRLSCQRVPTRLSPSGSSGNSTNFRISSGSGLTCRTPLLPTTSTNSQRSEPRWWP